MEHAETKHLERAPVCGAETRRPDGRARALGPNLTPWVGPHPAHRRIPVAKAPIATLAYDPAPYRNRPDQGHVKLLPPGGLLRLFEAAAAKAGLDGSEADHGENVGGEGAGLALGPGQLPPPSFQRGAHTLVPPGRFMAGQLVDLGDGAGGEAHGRDAGAITGALRQTARLARLL